jgi:hypothetical protein
MWDRASGNTGYGAFGRAVGHRTGRYPTSVVAADLGGDKRPDFAVAKSGLSTACVLTNTPKDRPPVPRGALL